MSNLQLYLAIGVPILVNLAFNGALILLLYTSMNRQFDAVNQRFDDMRDLWRAELGRAEQTWRTELRRVEEVLDTRLKSLGGAPPTLKTKGLS